MKRHNEDNTKHDEHDTVNKVKARWEHLTTPNKEDSIKGKRLSACIARKQMER